MTRDEREQALLKAEQEWTQEKVLKERELKLKQEKHTLRKASKRKISTSKLLIAFLFINCSIIEIFTGIITLKSLDLSFVTLATPDLTPLVTLIGAAVSEVIGFAVYALKSAKENTAGGIVYETAMANLHTSDGTEEKIIDPNAEG